MPGPRSVRHPGCIRAGKAGNQGLARPTGLRALGRKSVHVAQRPGGRRSLVWRSALRRPGASCNVSRIRWSRVGSIRSRAATLACVLLVLLGPVSCGGGSASGTEGGRGGTLTVLAASSLTDAFGELEKRFEERNPGVEVRQSFESSSTLLAQIQQGAPADVFASASEEEMETATKEGLVEGETRVFVKNREIVMVPKDNPANIQDFRDVAKPGVRLVLAQEDVPAADYAVEILGKANNEYGGDFKQDVLSNVVSREADVRASVNRVVVGDADATFGYASDYTPDIRDRVEVVPIPPDLNIIATYPIAALEDAEEPDLAREWVDLVTGEEGQRVLDKWGFEPAS
ncbi:molybdate ABC transporter substrate-binding protein [Rubrobacter tropicus]|uniref:Molybdate ABC transporter substrate-binding protein n=1 Tax=Rubrobacter tropicus TaxID=2653851 RepID=A0A6G8QE96_9ACTN|nr:molybdate ABC transporter substrate-binding protein [Rubrobacter tropicus]